MAEDDGKLTRSRDSIANTITVAIGVSLVCSILVAGTAVLLKPKQEQNRTRFRQQIVLEVAGLFEPGADIEQHALLLEFDTVHGRWPRDIAAVFIDNFRRFAAGERLRYSVDFERGY